MANKKRPYDIKHLSPDEASDLMQKCDQAAAQFKGQFDELESALGMLLLGRLVGWKVLVLIHNKRTIRKYEKILGIDIRESFPEEGPLVGKSVAYAAIQKIGNFWKAVSGDVKVPNRRELGNS